MFLLFPKGIEFFLLPPNAFREVKKYVSLSFLCAYALNNN